MPWKEAVSWFKDWLKANHIEPGTNLQKKLDIWSNNDIPGNELPRNYPRRDQSGMDLTPTSALGVDFAPHPTRDWTLVLSVSLGLDERKKLREAAGEEEGKSEHRDQPENALEKFEKWDETHGEIDVQKLLNDEYDD